MERLSIIGRYFYAIGLMGLGIGHFLFQDFVTGRAPEWPEGLAGQMAWAYLTGAAIIVSGLAVIAGKKARVAAILTAILIFLWAFLRHIPVITSDTVLSGAWTSAGKALVLIGGALAIAAYFPKVKSARKTALTNFINLEKEFVISGRICLGVFLLITGIQHFMFTEFVASLIPGWFPGDTVFWTYFTGVALISGGIGLFIPQTAPLAALLSGLMVFSWFWIIHIPRTLTSVSDKIAVFEALAVSGIAFVLSGKMKSRNGIYYWTI